MVERTRRRLSGLLAAAVAALMLWPQVGALARLPNQMVVDAGTVTVLPASSAVRAGIDGDSAALEAVSDAVDGLRLTAGETGGTQKREGIEFRMDPNLKGCTQAMREDYYGSGWTKGHLMPAADAAFSSSTLSETFYFTNICPQNETLNAGDWQYLEKKVRQWANRYGSVWVVTGPIVGENRYGTIGDRDVVVPDAFFKALLVRKKNGSYSAIAFVMDNDDDRYYLKDCCMTIDDLESLTGFDLYPALDDVIEEKVESTFRLSDWGIR